MMRTRKPVLILLFFTVLAPIVLYTDRLGNFNNSYLKTEFIDDVSTLKLEGNRKINALRQEILNDLKEPIGIIRLTEERDLNHSSSVEDAEETGLLNEEKTMGKPGERVLSTTTHGDVESGGENLIKQVTEVIPDHILEKEENKETEKEHTKMETERQNFTRDNEKNKVSQQKSETTTTKQDVTSRKESPPFASKGNSREPVKAASKVQIGKLIVPDAQVRHLRDQLIRAKVYLSLGLTRNNPHFIKDLQARVREVQRALGQATKDSELPRGIHDKLKAMEQTLAKGKEIHDDCSNVIKKLRAMLHSSEEQLRVHKKQTLFLTQLAAKTIPKGLHCLPLRLGTEYYLLNSTQQQFPNQEKLEDPKLYHYALFSDNILAAAVVVNSTVLNAKEPEKHVFHIVSDRLNYAAMRMWFLANSPGKATIEVKNVEEFTWLNSSYSPVLKQLGSQSMIDYYFRIHRASSDSNLKYRNPKYLNILNHLRFYLPEIFPKLHKVLFLDDDIVVQKDLTGIWMLNLKGKVNGAVETCGESFHRFDRYLNFSNPLISKNFDPRACGWAYGMNIFDLEEWKKQNITQIYHSWQKLNRDRQLWKLGTLPPGLITFWNQTYPLDRSWHVLGLGYNPNVSQKEIEHASVIHYNGNMKPWLEIGIPKFRNYWAKYVDYDQIYLRECNINP